MSRFSKCPQCDKKGMYENQGYDPWPSAGILYLCRYCNYIKRVRDLPKIEDFKRGTQIIYVPTHTQGKLDHADAETGFVTSTKDDTVFCRYWSKHDIGRLTTKEYSPGCNILEHLVIQDTRPQDEVDRFIALFDQIELDHLEFEDFNFEAVFEKEAETVYQDPRWPEGEKNDKND